MLVPIDFSYRTSYRLSIVTVALGRRELLASTHGVKITGIGLLHSIYTVSQKTCDYIFYNNFNNKCPITIIFGTVSSKSMRHRKMVSFPTSPI